MNKQHPTHYWIIGLFVAATGFCVQNADAQVNEARVERQASGLYRGGISGVKRVRRIPNHSNEVIRYGDSNGKLRVPVTERNFKTNMRDGELGGNGRARIKADGKNTRVTRGGKKISYTIVKAIFDTLQDGHRPIKKGTARGAMVRKGNKWVSNLALKGKRIDNDGYTSIFTADAKARH